MDIGPGGRANLAPKSPDESSMAHRLRLYRMATWLVIAIATALASAWAVRVPLLQEPDELAHLDYALELHAVGKPFTVSQARPSPRLLARVALFGSGYGLP